MTYSHTFGAWLADVESQLLSRVPAIYLNQIEPSQLWSAWQSKVTPRAFAHQAGLATISPNGWVSAPGNAHIAVPPTPKSVASPSSPKVAPYAYLLVAVTLVCSFALGLLVLWQASQVKVVVRDEVASSRTQIIGNESANHMETIEHVDAPRTITQGF